MKRVLSIALSIVAVLGIACSRKTIYTSSELQAEARFKRIDVGLTEQELRDRFGAPSCVVRAVPETPDRLEARCPESSEPQIFVLGDRATYPNGLPTLPTERPILRLLVYVEATVSAFYFIDLEGRVGLVKVWIS